MAFNNKYGSKLFYDTCFIYNMCLIINNTIDLIPVIRLQNNSQHAHKLKGGALNVS